MNIAHPVALEAMIPEPLMPLGPSRPNEALRPRLAAITVGELFAPVQVTKPEFAQACLAGLWLRHDFLDESHTISQDLHTAEGSWWHAMTQFP